MDENIQEPDAVPVFLQDMETERMLEFLQELYRLGVHKYIPLPQVRATPRTCIHVIVFHTDRE